MTIHWNRNSEGEKPQDTDIVRITFRNVMQRSAVWFVIVGLVYAAIFYDLGDSMWRWLVIVTLGSSPLLYLIGQRRSFPVFLTGTLSILVLVVACVTRMSWHVGHEAGFQYLLLLVIPIVMVAGRLGLGAKWMFIFGVTLYIPWLDSIAAAHAPEFAFNVHVIEGFHTLNIAIVSIVLAMMMQCYFVRVSEYQVAVLHLATTDSLTGLLNRRRLMEVADKAVAKARRFEAPLSVILCDVDFFKLVNDEHGHGAGDIVLQRVSQLLAEQAREYDSVCRWGGEEFLVLLPETTLENAGIIADRIRQSLTTLNIDIGTAALKITMTMGVAELGATEMLTDAVNRADEALYIGKSSGRNKAVLSRHPASTVLTFP